jgi:hypothetical protein
LSTITTLDCGVAFGALVGSVWMVQLKVKYFGHTAQDTNVVFHTVSDIYNNNFLQTSHTVDFNHAFTVRVDTFIVFFCQVTRLKFMTQLSKIPPSSKNYRISSMEVLFTRIA